MESVNDTTKAQLWVIIHGVCVPFRPYGAVSADLRISKAIQVITGLAAGVALNLLMLHFGFLVGFIFDRLFFFLQTSGRQRKFNSFSHLIDGLYSLENSWLGDVGCSPSPLLYIFLVYLTRLQIKEKEYEHSTGVTFLWFFFNLNWDRQISIYAVVCLALHIRI